jgi:protein-S-isoprenylcysteine O-methyltransferase Ste14
LVFRVIVRRDYQKNKQLSPLSSFLETIIFFIYGCLTYTFEPPDWPEVFAHPAQEVIGWALIGFGAIAAFGTMAWFGMRRALGQEVTVLRQTGPYRLTRNPQLVGFGLVLVGFVLLWPSWYALGWLLLYPIVSHMMVLTEEEHLRNVFGEEYEAYCKKVPRYLGLPRL